MLTKEDILLRIIINDLKDLNFEDVEIKEWGGFVRVRCMTGSERDAFEASIYEIKGTKANIIRENFRAKLIARTLINEKGERLFTDKEIELIGKKAAKPLDKIFTVAQRLNGLSQADEDEFVKNSESEGEDISISTSPKSSK